MPTDALGIGANRGNYNFLTERTEDGMQLLGLAVIDEFTRARLVIEAAGHSLLGTWSLSGSICSLYVASFNGRLRCELHNREQEYNHRRPRRGHKMDHPGCLRGRGGRYGFRGFSGGVARCSA